MAEDDERSRVLLTLACVRWCVYVCVCVVLKGGLETNTLAVDSGVTITAGGLDVSDGFTVFSGGLSAKDDWSSFSTLNQTHFGLQVVASSIAYTSNVMVIASGNQE